MSDRTILTPRHIAAIQAALRYWAEEMEPHDAELFSAYLEGESPAELPTSDDVAWLRENLKRVNVRYAICWAGSLTLADDRLFESIEQAEAARMAAEEPIVPVLVFRESGHAGHAFCCASALLRLWR